MLEGKNMKGRNMWGECSGLWWLWFPFSLVSFRNGNECQLHRDHQHSSFPSKEFFLPPTEFMFLELMSFLPIPFYYSIYTSFLSLRSLSWKSNTQSRKEGIRNGMKQPVRFYQQHSSFFLFPSLSFLFLFPFFISTLFSSFHSFLSFLISLPRSHSYSLTFSIFKEERCSNQIFFTFFPFLRWITLNNHLLLSRSCFLVGFVSSSFLFFPFFISFYRNSSSPPLSHSLRLLIPALPTHKKSEFLKYMESSRWKHDWKWDQGKREGEKRERRSEKIWRIEENVERQRKERGWKEKDKRNGQRGKKEISRTRFFTQNVFITSISSLHFFLSPFFLLPAF